MLRGEPITIFVDGKQTRNFVNVRDVVQANIRTAMTKRVSGAFNIGSGGRITINRLAEMLQQVSGIHAKVVYGPPRPGDVRHSLAGIDAARKAFGFIPVVTLEEGLQEYMEWARIEAGV